MADSCAVQSSSSEILTTAKQLGQSQLPRLMRFALLGTTSVHEGALVVGHLAMEGRAIYRMEVMLPRRLRLLNRSLHQLREIGLQIERQQRKGRLLGCVVLMLPLSF